MGIVTQTPWVYMFGPMATVEESSGVTTETQVLGTDASSFLLLPTPGRSSLRFAQVFAGGGIATPHRPKTKLQAMQSGPLRSLSGSDHREILLKPTDKLEDVLPKLLEKFRSKEIVFLVLDDSSDPIEHPAGFWRDLMRSEFLDAFQSVTMIFKNGMRLYYGNVPGKERKQVFVDPRFAPLTEVREILLRLKPEWGEEPDPLKMREELDSFRILFPPDLPKRMDDFRREEKLRCQKDREKMDLLFAKIRKREQISAEELNYLEGFLDRIKSNGIELLKICRFWMNAALAHIFLLQDYFFRFHNECGAAARVYGDWVALEHQFKNNCPQWVLDVCDFKKWN